MNDRAGSAAADAATEKAAVEQLELIRFLYADHGGVIRGAASVTRRP